MFRSLIPVTTFSSDESAGVVSFDVSLVFDVPPSDWLDEALTEASR